MGHRWSLGPCDASSRCCGVSGCAETGERIKSDSQKLALLVSVTAGLTSSLS
jgi:hypothetical protein